MNTFINLYDFLRGYPNDVKEWLNDKKDKWKGKDKQESLLRLFAGLGLIDKLHDFNICKGNYNERTISLLSSLKELFYEDNKEIMLKDKGSSSDLTGFHKYNNKHLLLTTSKNLKKYTVGDLDIDKLKTNFEKYEKDGHVMTLCLCIRDIAKYEIMKSRIEKTNQDLKNILDKKHSSIVNVIVLDWDDLSQAFNMFKNNFKHIKHTDIVGSITKPLTLKMHQRYSVIKTLKLKNENIKTILWGHVPRSGKSYIIKLQYLKILMNTNKQ